MLGRAFRFHTPCSILVVGPSGCGKTRVHRVGQLRVFDTPPTQDQLLLWRLARPFSNHARRRGGIPGGDPKPRRLIVMVSSRWCWTI